MVIYCKRSLTALDLMAIVRELNNLFGKAYVNNIYSISDSIFQFKFGGFKCNLIFELGRRINISGFEFEKPKMPTPFCSFLRSKFCRSKIVGISQFDFDRIIEFQFDNDLKLIFEFMDQGNLLVLDVDGKIIGVFNPKVLSDRKLLNGELYIPPKIRGFNPFKVDFNELHKSFINSTSSLVVSLTKLLNIPGELAEELCFRCGFNKNMKANNLKFEDLEYMLNCFYEMISSIESGCLNPQIVSSCGKIVSVIPLDFTIYSNLESEFFSDFNNAVDEYFNRLMNLEFEEFKNKVRGEVEGKFKVTISKQKEALREMKLNAEKFRIFGKLVMENLNLIDDILKSIRESALKIGWSNVLSEIEKSNPEFLKYIVDFNVKDRLVKLNISGEIIQLNVLESAASNASKFFNEAKTLEAKASRAIEAIKSLEDRMVFEIEEEIKKRILKPIRIISLVKKLWYENYYWFKSSDGILIVGGRDASQNEALVRKWLRDDGIYVHADVHGGPSVIVISDSSIVPDSTIYEAAQFAVSFSNAWRGMLEVSSAFWVYGRQVSKSAPSGEYLTRGAFMIYGKKNYIHDIPLRISIGIMNYDGLYKLISGPKRAISKWCFRSLDLAPGEKSIDDIYPILKKNLVMGLDDEQKLFIKNLSIDDFKRILPRGGFRFISME